MVNTNVNNIMVSPHTVKGPGMYKNKKVVEITLLGRFENVDIAI